MQRGRAQVAHANAPIWSLSLPEQVARWLIDEIVEERLLPGDRVTQQYVAERCQVSEGSVRDAFRAVEKLGLVRLLPRRGIVVTPVSVAELRELFEIRTAITRVCIKKILQFSTADQKADLLEGAKNLQSLVDDEKEFFVASNAMSEKMVAYAGSDRVRELMLPVALQINRYRHHGFSSRKAREASADGFLEIAEAVIRGDEVVALETLEKVSARLTEAVLQAFGS